MTRRIPIFAFKSCNVKIAIKSNRVALVRKIRKEMLYILPIKWTEIAASEAEYIFDTRLTGNLNSGKISVRLNDEMILEESDVQNGIDLLISRLRLTIAEFADQLVFLHAGVVGWKGQAIIIPGRSFSGKTTLVAEFAKNGCEYFSDEYALINKNGKVQPFLKKLSMRGIVDDYTQVDLSIDEIGGKIARKALPVGCVLGTEYKKSKKSKSKIEEISLGDGIMASIANSISIRQNPKFVIEILNLALANAEVLKTVRGEAKEFVKSFFDYFERRENKAQ